MLGMVSTTLRPIQYSHLLSAPSMMNVDDWLSQLIDKLLHIAHGQWIYRNISKHHATLGSIKKAERRQMLLEIDQLLQLSPEDVPEDSKFLLEIDFSAMRSAALHSVEKTCKTSVNTAQPPIPHGFEDDTVPTHLSKKSKRASEGSGLVSDMSNKRRKPD